MPVFSSKGAGANLIRSTMVLGRLVRLKTGHGFYRVHKLPSGQLMDLTTSSLTPDPIEAATVQDIEAILLAGAMIPKVGPGVARPLHQSVTVGNIIVTYRVVESPGGIIDVPTYYQT